MRRINSMGRFFHITHRVSSRDMTKIGLMILLVRLKISWRILNFAGTVFEVKVAPANDLHQKIFAGARQKIPALDFFDIFQSITNKWMHEFER